MLIVVGIMLCGVAVGYYFRKRKLKFISNLIMIAIYMLLFFLGVTVGGNREIMDNLSTIGVDGLIITIAALLGSCLAALFIYNRFFRNFNNEG